MIKNEYVLSVYNDFKKKNEGKKEYIQAVSEILESLELLIENNEEYVKENILERFLEPERYIEFRVSWLDDSNNVRVNKGYRVQYNSAIGPYKGGLRFHPSVNESIIKFLGVEQCLKNSLTTLPMGGGKGGSDFDPKGKSDKEIMRFCQAFMNELYRHIGKDTDVPAGDIGVGAKEIGYLFGQYKKIKNEFNGVLTGKGLSYGGSLGRKEATGYGLCYFTNESLRVQKNTSLEGKVVVISGSGNVAIYALEKALELGAKVIAMSDSNGYIIDEKGINLEVIKDIKEVKKGRIKEYLNYVSDAKYVESNGVNPSIWSVKCDIAMPCATQNELDLNDAKMLVANGVIGVYEGANMPTTLEAYNYLVDNDVIYGPGKASNAGGVSVSGLEMTQNALRLSWSKEEVDQKLKDIMINIFHNVYNTNIKYNIKSNDLLKGANIAGFVKIADAMIAQGVI